MSTSLLHHVQTFLKSRRIKALLCFCVALILLLSTETLQRLDHETSSAYYKETLEEAALAYAGVRLLNASVSVIMESDLQIQPAGVGLSLALGQVLDPLNDLCERVSDALVLAIVSLTLQQLLYSISLNYAPYIVAALFVLLGLFYTMANRQTLVLQNASLRLLLFILLLRALLPLSATINTVIYQEFFQPAIAETHSALELAGSDINALADFTKPKQNISSNAKANNIWQQWFAASSMHETADFLAQKSEQIKQAFLSKKQQAAMMVEYLLELMSLYIALFVIQILLLPILMLYLSWRLIQLLCPHAKT